MVTIHLARDDHFECAFHGQHIELIWRVLLKVQVVWLWSAEKPAVHTICLLDC